MERIARRLGGSRAQLPSVNAITAYPLWWRFSLFYWAFRRVLARLFTANTGPSPLVRCQFRCHVRPPPCPAAGPASTATFPTTVHGFRSSLRDWASDATSYPSETAEHALTHAVGGAVERSYARSDQLERRTAMMQDWADFIRPQARSAKVVNMRRAP